MGGVLVHCRVTPRIKFVLVAIYTPGWRGVERGDVRMLSFPRTQLNEGRRGGGKAMLPPYRFPFLFYYAVTSGEGWRGVM